MYIRITGISIVKYTIASLRLFKIRFSYNTGLVYKVLK